MSSLIELELAESYEVGTGYVWMSVAVDAGEVGSILPADADKDGTDVSEVYVKGMHMYKSSKNGKDDVAFKVPGRIAKGNWRELMKRVNDARH